MQATFTLLIWTPSHFYSLDYIKFTDGLRTKVREKRKNRYDLQGFVGLGFALSHTILWFIRGLHSFCEEIQPTASTEKQYTPPNVRDNEV